MIVGLGQFTLPALFEKADFATKVITVPGIPDTAPQHLKIDIIVLRIMPTSSSATTTAVFVRTFAAAAPLSAGT